MDTKTLPLRSEIDEVYKWDLSALYTNIEAFEADFKTALEDLPHMQDFKGHLTDSASSLYDYLAERDRQMQRIDRLYSFAFQKSDEDTGDTLGQTLKSRTFRLYTDFAAAIAFESPEILTLTPKALDGYFEDFPALLPYRHALHDILRQKSHTLTSDMEALLSMSLDMASGPQTIFNMFNNADIKFPEIKDSEGKMVEITNGRFVTFLESSDRRVRKDAFTHFYKTYEAHKNTLAAMYQANVKKELFYSRSRKYTSSLEAHLDTYNIPVSVYDQLIEAVHRHLPAMYRYVALRKKLLNVEELHMYDVYTPIIDYNYPEFSYDKALEAVLSGLSPLGSDYTARLKKGFDHRWIDVFENKGKRSGAYSTCVYKTHPYVLLNYQGNLDNVFTIAHEMGHSLHSCYTNEAQDFVNSEYSIFVAEIASTCNESLLMNYFINQAKDTEEKKYLLNHFLDKFKGTLFRQTMFAEFEKITHSWEAEGKTLTSEALCSLYRELNETYFGPDMVIDDEIGMEWARIPHFYTPFYVYQYATGFAAANAFSTQILNEGDSAVKRYIKFLSGGCSKEPIKLLQDAGVDMTTPEPMETALTLFENVLGQLEKLCENGD